MGKQTMGTPVHTWNLQAETKLYRLQTPGTPLFRPVHYDNIGLDDFPMGTNAIVAVISYTVKINIISDKSNNLVFFKFFIRSSILAFLTPLSDPWQKYYFE